MATRIHMIRHGEVENPDHLVYASLPGFDLSDLGRDQARLTARYLGRAPIVAVWSSPLERALRTAEPLAARLGQAVHVDPDVAEWALLDRWQGVSWEDLPTAFPGELEAYLQHPIDLEFSPESLDQLATRVSGSLRALHATYPHGDVAVVSHAGPVRAATMALTGTTLAAYWDSEPGHASVTTFLPRSDQSWVVETIWQPETSS